MNCPACQNPIPEGSRFCNACGAALSPQPAASSHSASASTAGERRQVTVLFSDLSGYTAMGERLDPEEVREVMSRVFGEASRIITGYGGVIEKYIGDAVMAVFGLNRAHEDDAVRAIRAARELHAFVDTVSPSVAARLGRPIAMHTGINTGQVVTGNTGSAEGAMGVVGDAVNVASRLSGLAKAGEVFVGADTATQAGRFFDLEELPAAEVKGKAEAVRVFRVTGTRERPQATRRFAGLRAPLIGREVEYALLKQSTQRLRDGKGSIIALRAEAGTGKSRLLEEFRTGLPENYQWLTGNAYDHTRDIPYAPVVDMLSGAWRIREEDKPAQVREKLENGAGAVLAEPGDHVAYLGSLFSLGYEQVANVSPEYRKEKLRDALLALFEGMARQQPTVFHMEDMHWADPSTIELLRHVLTNFKVPAITVASYRPPFHLFLDSSIPGFREVELEALSPTLTEDMTGALLEGATAPRELVRFVKDRAGGNPFFIEEMVTALIEAGALARDNGAWKLTGKLEDFNVPGTVQGVIAARLDRLEPQSKRLLQEASVIGRSFFYEVLGRITSVSDDLRQRLDGLEHQDMVRSQALEPDLEYVFKHPLIQEVVYHSLLTKDRQTIHERVGRAIEEVLTERLPEYYERLAHHFLHGESRDKAVEYLIQAGEKALRNFNLTESLEHLQHAYRLIGVNPERGEKEQLQLFKLLDAWGLNLYYQGNFRELIKLSEKHEQEAESLKDTSTRAMFFAWFGLGLWLHGQVPRANQMLRKALTLAETAGNHRAQAYSYAWLCWTCGDLARFEEGISYGWKGLEIAQAHLPDDAYPLFKNLTGIAYCYFHMGDASNSNYFAERSLQLSVDLGSLRGQSLSYLVLGSSRIAGGDAIAAADYLKKAASLTTDPFYRTLPFSLLGIAQAVAEDFEQMPETLEKVEELVQAGSKYFEPFINIIAGSLCFYEGRFSEGLKQFHRSFDVLVKGENFVITGWHLVGMCYLKILIGEKPPLGILLKNVWFLLTTIPQASKKAEFYLSGALEIAEKTKALGLEAQVRLSLASLEMFRKKPELAREHLAIAIETFEQVGATAYLAQTREALAQLEGKAPAGKQAAK